MKFVEYDRRHDFIVAITDPHANMLLINFDIIKEIPITHVHQDCHRLENVNQASALLKPTYFFLIESKTM